MFRVALGGLLMTAVVMQDASGQMGYQRPPKAVTDILDVPAPPAASVSPGGEHVLFVEAARYPSIAEVAEPMLKLGGLRINPKTNGPARAARYISMSLMKLPDGKSRPVEIPAKAKLGAPIWSHDGKRFAVTNTTDSGIELWRGDVSDAKLIQVPGVTVNAAIGRAVDWLPGEDKLLVQTIPAGRGKAPEAPLAPTGPVVQESSGKAAPVRTFQDLLKDSHDEALFDHYCTSQLVVAGQKHTPIGKPGVFLDADVSPDGKYILVTRVKRPYSYLHPYPSFPRAVEVWDRATGEVVMQVADLPLQDKVPIEGVPTGPRSIRWVPTDPHKLVWVEALDGGDPKAKADHRDVVKSQVVGGRGPAEVVKLEHRFAGLDFLPTDNRFLVRDYDRDRKWSRTFLVSTSVLNSGEPQLIFDRSVQDRYGDPGTPLTRTLPNGQRVVRTAGDVAGNTIFLAGAGASPQGDRPFLDRFDLTTKRAERLFHCGEKEYAQVVAVLNKDGSKLLVQRESPSDPPNFFYKDANHDRPITKNADPAPEFRKADKTMIRAKRADGVELTVTLHTPAGWKKGEKLPAVMIAYPTEFASAADAGQVVGSPNRFTTVAGPSHLFFLTQGYAVMEVTMPVVGPPETANDTFIDQLVMNAKAAIDVVSHDDRPVDRTRVGVMGHSYGAFMTANLLAHSDLFRAGIGRSGAYNRTLTPFGFQNERRTFWEAPAVYAKMSPFDSAHKLKTPLLLIHGAADANPGTFPVQSERMYAAVRGNGGTARLVLLPHEDHGYAARESIEHVLHEQIAWFDKHVKQATSGK
ncbi:MAG TPA: prolyl oligopeptidase family serine peptidase [Gemmataceae bacterium]|nr:prolyl oligopeptidase family serine peptidase [Gemmataceae bacterium]